MLLGMRALYVHVTGLGCMNCNTRHYMVGICTCHRTRLYCIMRLGIEMFVCIRFMYNRTFCGMCNKILLDDNVITYIEHYVMRTCDRVKCIIYVCHKSLLYNKTLCSMGNKIMIQYVMLIIRCLCINMSKV